MATLQAATASTGATVTDAQAVRQLCEAHCFGTLNWEVDEEGELIIWGYDAFEIYETREDGLPDYEGGLVTHEFLRKLANYLESGEELDIQTAGTRSVGSRFWRSDTWFATARSSTRTSAPSKR